MEGLGDGDEAFVERMQMDIASSSTSCTNFSSDVNRMPEAPPRRGTHRRAQSETAFQLPDDLLFEEAPTPLDEMGDDLLSMYLDMDYLGTTTSGSSRGGNDDTSAYPGSGHHSRSLSMDGMLGVGGGFDNGVGGKEAMGRGESFDAPRPRHQHSYSMDGSTSFNESSELFESKKASAAKKLAELALVDPKRAKRILANRLSAARSKERKMRYISELERKVQTLQTEATTLSAQLTLLQRDTNALTSENSELRLRLQALEQQAQLRDALNVALKEDVQRLKLASGQLSGMSNLAFNHGTHQHVPPKPQYPHNNFPHPEFTLSDSFGFQVKSGSFANSSVKSESSSGSVNPNNGS